MTNSSIYNVFERMWQHAIAKFNNCASTEALDNHIEDKNNPHEVTVEQVGLENVDNTSDLDKPISYATQAALDEKSNLNHQHSADHITSGVLNILRGGTGYDSIADTVYSTPRYRASALHSTETIPYYNGTINWVYE